MPALGDSLRVDRSVDGEGPASSPAIDAAQLRRFVGQGCFAGSDVALVASPPDVQFFPLRLPEAALAQTPERIQQVLNHEVAQQSRSDAGEIELRYWTLPRVNSQQANIMAVVMPAQLARQWCEILEQENLNLRRIDVSPCALIRLAAQVWTPADDDLWGVLDLGFRHSTLTVCSGRTATYIRPLSISTHSWTQRIASAFEVSYGVAEQLKRDHGVQPTDRGHRPQGTAKDLSRAMDPAAALSSVLRDSLHQLAQEAGRCFSYVMQGFPDHAVKRLFLAGGGAAMTGLPETLESELGIPVGVLGTQSNGDEQHWENPIAGVSFDSVQAGALGAAILDMENS